MKERNESEPEVAGAKGPFRKDALLQKVKKIGEKAGRNIVLINSMAVCGRDHLLSAYHHASKAFLEHRALARDFSAEFFRYLTGERQVSVAIEKGGIRDGCSMVILSEIPVDTVIGALGLERDDSLIECTEEKKNYLGINVAGIKGEDMALELTAMVALL